MRDRVRPQFIAWVVLITIDLAYFIALGLLRR